MAQAILALVPLPRDWCYIAYVPPTNAQIMVLKAKVAVKAPVVKSSVVKKKAPAATEEKACKAGCKWCEKGECWVSSNASLVKPDVPYHIRNAADEWDGLWQIEKTFVHCTLPKPVVKDGKHFGHRSGIRGNSFVLKSVIVPEAIHMATPRNFSQSSSRPIEPMQEQRFAEASETLVARDGNEVELRQGASSFQ